MHISGGTYRILILISGGTYSVLMLISGGTYRVLMLISGGTYRVLVPITQSVGTAASPGLTVNRGWPQDTCHSCRLTLQTVLQK